jgi:hypothetical protein
VNFRECRRILETGLDRDDLRDNYGLWVNRALRSIQADYNYNCMRHDEFVTIPSGATGASLPVDYKELQNARPPVWVRSSEIDGRAGWLPCDVRREEEPMRTAASLYFPHRTSRGPDVWLSTDGDRWFLNMLDVALGDVQFRVKYFRFLPPLREDDDSNDLTRSYEEMVSHKIKAIGFAEISDPAATAFETLYEMKRRTAQGDDARRWLAGRRLQMGG